MIVKIVPFRICESVYTDGCGSNSVSVSSPLRGVLQFFSGSTGVLSGKDWSPFRRGLGKFPYACPGISPGMARDVRKQTEKKVYTLYRWLISTYRSCPKISWKKVVKMFGSYVLQHYFCTRFREGKWHGRFATATVREEKKKKLPKKFGSSEKLLTFAVTFREGAAREEIFERIFIPTKVVQVSRPESFRIEWAVN